MATCVNNEELKNFDPEDLSIPDISDMDIQAEDDGDDKLTVRSTSDRRVCGTEIFELDESGVCLAMVTHAICTMCKSKPIPSHLIAEDQEYVVYGKDDWYWSPSPWKNSDRPVFVQMPTERCTNFYILKPLGAGEHGRVWLACSRNRLVCALKFRQYGWCTKRITYLAKNWVSEITCRHFDEEQACHCYALSIDMQQIENAA